MRNGYVSLLTLLFFLFINSPVSGETINIDHWDSLTGNGWNYNWSTPSIEIDLGSPSPQYVLKWTFPVGYPSGYAPGIAYYTLSPPRTEIWCQYYFKYSDNWQWHPIANKHIYHMNSSGNNNFTITLRNTAHEFALTPQLDPPWNDSSCPEGVCKTKNYYSNTGYNPSIEVNRWYKVVYKAKMNTPGKADGIFQLWLDDRMVLDYKNIPFRSPSESGVGWRNWQLAPVWGGEGDPKKVQDYMYYDFTIISSETTDLKSPKPPSNLIIN